MSIDTTALDAFLGRFVADLAATSAAGNVVIGHQLGLYRALAGGPLTAAELADRTATHARPLREWLYGQAAGGYVTITDDGRFTLSPEQAFCLADPDGAVYLPGAFQLALGALRGEPRVAESFRTGTGVGWHEHDEDVFLGCEAFFRPGYSANVVKEWIPALGDIEQRLHDGGRIADIGCGLGATSIIMDEAYPTARVFGSDYHAESVDRARARADQAALGDRVTFEVASAATFSGTGYDLVTSFDCLHDMGDPVAAARRVREAIAPDGCWLLVEPAAADDPTDNLNPVGRMYYSFSTLLCVPNALSQGGTRVLGAQAGPHALAGAVRQAGFTRCERVSGTPFNDVYAVRP